MTRVTPTVSARGLAGAAISERLNQQGHGGRLGEEARRESNVAIARGGTTVRHKFGSLLSSLDFN